MYSKQSRRFKSKHVQHDHVYHTNVNVDLMGKNVIQINGRIITINVDVSLKKRHVCEKIIFGILLHVVVKIESI